MFRDTVGSLWVERYREVDACLTNLQQAVADLRQACTKLDQAHTDDKVPTEACKELVAEMTEAECKLSSARMDEIKIDEVLHFCERILCNAPMLWKDCVLDQQQRLQQLLFREGVSYNRLLSSKTLLILQRLRRRS